MGFHPVTIIGEIAGSLKGIRGAMGAPGCGFIASGHGVGG